MGTIPENLTLLHSGEESYRKASIALVEADPDLSSHIAMTEACMDMLQYARMNTPEMTEDQIVVAILGASVFNSIGSALKLMFSGYYQASGLQVRYILETGWLVDYLKSDPKLVQAWKSADEKERQVKFKPVRVREQLDKRDGYKTKKRAEHYNRLCEHCGHPTFTGFALLRPEPHADAHMGPFVAKPILRALVEELIKCAIVAANAVMGFFPPITVRDHRARLHFLEMESAWIEKYVGHKPDQTAINELKKLLATFA